MLQIIMLLFKIIGILLLCALGLILLLLLTTLFIPIRYRVALEHGENKFYLKSRVSWLLHVVHISITHIEGLLQIQARLFGFVVFDSLKPRKPKEKKEAEGEKAVKKLMKKKKIAKKKITKEKGKITKEKITKRNIITNSAVDNSTVENDVVNNSAVNNIAETNNVTNNNTVSINTAESNSINHNLAEKKQDIQSKQIIAVVPEIMVESTAPTSKSFFRAFQDRIKNIWIKIITFIREMKEKISRVLTTISSLQNKAGLIWDFLRDEINKEGMHITFSSLKRLFKHILPTKLKSRLTFGTGDPCSTGQALGAMSILYSFYGDRIRITPDFERSILEGQHFAKGRIRLVTILIIVVKLIFDKKFKQLKNNFIILKEAL